MTAKAKGKAKAKARAKAKPKTKPAADDASLAAKKAMHRRKVAVGLAMAAFAGGAVVADWYIGLDICFHVIVIAITIKGLLEFYDMCASSRTGPFRGFGIGLAVALVLLHWVATPGTLAWFGEHLSRKLGQLEELLVGDELVLLGLVVAVLGSMWLQATKRDNDRTFEAISTTLFGIFYIWFLASFLVKLRHLGSDGVLGSDLGVLGSNLWNRSGTGYLASCIAVSKVTDAGGYLVGRKIGRHKMIPRISPNKSYEGLVAGLAMSVGMAFLLWHLRVLWLGPAWAVALFGFLVGGMGTMGDLAESLLKRGSGRKDTGDLVPGFGGALDVVDSLLLSAPVAYLLLVVLLRAGAGWHPGM
ncbi:MAG: phosphatidate cytidylyltransferase [Planctomycetota bacterium]|jgi:phosphatidate cytidylyltransferase